MKNQHHQLRRDVNVSIMSYEGNPYNLHWFIGSSTSNIPQFVQILRFLKNILNEYFLDGKYESKFKENQEVEFV